VAAAPAVEEKQASPSGLSIEEQEAIEFEAMEREAREGSAQ